jgi:hypothetical protein
MAVPAWVFLVCGMEDGHQDFLEAAGKNNDTEVRSKILLSGKFREIQYSHMLSLLTTRTA